MANSKQSVVMQILPALENGGVERGTIDIAKALKNNNFTPIVVSNGGILTHQLHEANIQHIKLKVNSKNPFVIYNNIKKIKQLIAQYSVNIIHVRSRAPMWSSYFACKNTNTKLVSTVHGSYSLNLFSKKPSRLKIFYNAIMLKADAIIVVSNFIKDRLKENYSEIFNKISPKKITVIQRGVELETFNPDKISQNLVIDLMQKWQVPMDKKIILMPARFTQWKGHEFLIDALSKVKNDFYCLLVGSDHGHEKYRQKIEQKITDLNLGKKIKIVGICKSMPIAYKMANIVICSSVRPEAFGRISIEAQASKKPIISTAIGGALETVIDNKTGFLAEVNNSDNLAQIIDKALLLNNEDLEKMGANGRKNIEKNFSNEKMCNSTIAIYRNLLA